MTTPREDLPAGPPDDLTTAGVLSIRTDRATITVFRSADMTTTLLIHSEDHSDSYCPAATFGGSDALVLAKFLAGQ